MQQNKFIELAIYFPHIIDNIVYYSHGSSIESLIKIKNVELLNILIKCESIKKFVCTLIDCYKKVKNDWHEFKNIDEMYRTKRMSICVVKQDGHMLQYIKNQTPEICLTAIQQNGYAITFVKKQTPEMCLAAVKKKWFCIKWGERTNP